MRTLLHQRDGRSYHIPFSTDVTGRVTRKVAGLWEREEAKAPFRILFQSPGVGLRETATGQ
jgi:hypothetical protein